MMRALAALALALALGGCAEAPPGQNISPLMVRYGNLRIVPQGPDEALIMFIRENEDNNATQATLYEIANDGDHFIGVSSGSTRVAWAVHPGYHLFMVIGETADFLSAQVDGGKTYYMMVAPRWGFFKSRFSFRAVRREELGGPEWQAWQQLELLRCGPDCASWVSQNVNSIQRHKEKDLAFWKTTKSSYLTSGIMPEDGW
jgi:hypothetical protein